MDIRTFYHKIRQVELGIAEPWVVTMSLETPDGGVPNVPAEVTKAVAARLIVAGKARLASEEEAAEYRRNCERAIKAAEELAANARVQLTVISENDLRALRSGPKKV